MRRLLMRCVGVLIPLLLMTNLLLAQRSRVLEHFTLQMEGDTVCYSASVPGVLQQDLIKHEVISHHFIGGNEDSVQWVSDNNWFYHTTFSIDQAELREAKDYLLHLSWVDTYSEVYLNGALVGRTDNFFKSYSFSLKPYLVAGKNRLSFRFISPTVIGHAHYLSTGFNYPADNDRYPIKYSPFVRTPPYHFGWDWGPRLISIGFGAPVVLERVDGLTLGASYVWTDISWQGEAEAAYASVHFQSAIQLHGCSLEEVEKHMTFTLLSPTGERIAESIPSLKGDLLESHFDLNRPELWMPNGWGEPTMYAIERRYHKESYLVVDTIPFGIREVRLDTSREEQGQRFTFVVNNRPLYAKGANYLPHDRRFGGGGRTLQEFFEEDIVPAHFNMLRVWGGGTYETEEFYRLADQHGILIWQDFPFACSTYPNDPTFRASVSDEAKSQLQRLRNHPSLALLCGNNEVLEGLKHWGWKRKYGYSDEVWAKMFDDYDSFFRGLLPDLVKEHAPHVDYIHGSPMDSNWGKPESFLNGDSHNWRVWFGAKDFSDFDQNPGRFSSEFGFQSFPEMKTIQSFAPGYNLDTLTIYSPILEHRQRSFIGNQRITDYMQRWYPVPDTFSDYVYVGQVLQGRGMGYALRAVRRAYPLNMGALYWQLNDVWPTVSWSSIDYWGNYKALHYEVREAYAPFLIDLVEYEPGVLTLMAVSDYPDFRGKLAATIYYTDYYGNEVGTARHYVADVSSTPFSIALASFPKSDLPGEDIIAHLTLQDEQGTTLALQRYYPLPPKEMRLPTPKIEVETKAFEGYIEVALTSSTLVKDLFIGTPWQGAKYTQNYFDLMPNELTVLYIHHPDIHPDTKVDLQIQHINGILQKYPLR